jgi:hypothetical protein
MWIAQNVIALTGAVFLLAGCALLAARLGSGWAKSLLASAIAFLLVAWGAEFYMLQGASSPAFLALMVDYQSLLAVATFFVASLSFLMVARSVRRTH